MISLHLKNWYTCPSHASFDRFVGDVPHVNASSIPSYIKLNITELLQLLKNYVIVTSLIAMSKG
jgi:hypothetical protein